MLIGIDGPSGQSLTIPIKARTQSSTNLVQTATPIGLEKSELHTINQLLKLSIRNVNVLGSCALLVLSPKGGNYAKSRRRP